jgi:hypothetical protein
MVSEVTLHHALQPRSDQHDWLMHLPTQLLLNGKELCPQSLRRRSPPDHKMAPGVPATIVGEPKEREGFRLPFSALPTIGRREASELDQSRLLRMDLQSKLRQPFLKVAQEPLRVRLVLKAGNKIVSVANDDDVTPRDLLPPDLDPEVENVMQVEIG